jgi:hypothetical protein
LSFPPLAAIATTTAAIATAANSTPLAACHRKDVAGD